MPDRIETELLFILTLPARPERLVLVRAMVQKTVESTGCNSELGNRLVIAVNEACMNIIQHAYKGDPNGRFTLEASRSGQTLCFRLEDQADKIDLEAVKPRQLEDSRPPLWCCISFPGSCFFYLSEALISPFRTIRCTQSQNAIVDLSTETTIRL